jgi:pre-rRNA-processing protein TSR3
MFDFPPTIILRHRRENLKKCSLRGLEGREDLIFLTYPLKEPLPNLSCYVVLTMEAPILSQKEAFQGIFLMDGTWRLAEKMYKTLPLNTPFRSLPPHFKTAYPRRQPDCPDPDHGLASIEALFIAYHLLGRNTEGFLNNYHWATQFISTNAPHFR